MDSFGKLIVLVVIPFLVGFYGVRYYNVTQVQAEPPVQTVQTVQTEPQVPQTQMNTTQIEMGRIKCIKHGDGYCEEFVTIKVVKE